METTARQKSNMSKNALYKLHAYQPSAASLAMKFFSPSVLAVFALVSGLVTALPAPEAENPNVGEATEAGANVEQIIRPGFPGFCPWYCRQPPWSQWWLRCPTRCRRPFPPWPPVGRPFPTVPGAVPGGMQPATGNMNIRSVQDDLEAELDETEAEEAYDFQ